MGRRPESGTTVRRLTLFAERLIQLSLNEKRLWTELADLGCVSSTAMPVSAGDSTPIARLKESLFRLKKERARIVDELAGMGAKVCDWDTMEILLPGGPEAGSFRSWMPGEPVIAWWRRSKKRDSRREHLPGLNSRDIGPNHH